MEASDIGHDRGVVVGVDKGEVVRSHLREPVGVLVDEGGLRDRVSASRGRKVEDTSRVERRGVGVVGPLTPEGGVTGGEEQNLDRVGEADVEGLLRVGERGERLARGGLDLLDEDVPGGAGHTLPLVVGDDGVVGPDLGVSENGGGGDVSSDNRHTPGTGPRVLSDEKVLPIPEGEGNAHLVVGKGGGGEGNTTVPAVEEGKGKVEGGRGKDVLVGARGGELSVVSDHVVVTIALAGGHGEGSPEVEVVVVKPSSDEVVEGDAAVPDKIVHQVPGPTNTGGGTGSGGTDRGEGKAKPRVKEVITSARHGDRPLLAEGRSSRRAGQDNGDLGEPGSLPRLADEVSSRVGAAVKVLLDLVESSEIDEARGNIRSANRSHFL